MKYIKLKDVCKINMGQSPDSSSYNESGEGIPFFQGNADFGDRYPVTRIWCSEPKKVAQENDILISVRAPIGAINYSKEKCCIGRGLAALTVDKTKISEKLLFWVLKAKKEELNRQGTGSTFKAISKKSLEELLIPQIDIKEQEKDVEILEKIYMIIQNKHKELKLLTDLISSRFVEEFGDLKINPKKWKIKTFDEMTDLITDGEHATPRRTEEGIYLLSARNIMNHTIKLEDVDYIDQAEYDRISKRIHPKEGDVLISCSGTVGRCCSVPAELKFQMVRSVALLRFKNEINPIFAEYMITSDYLKEQIDRSKTQSSQANLFQGKIKKLKGFVPPIDLQNQFAAFVQQVNKSKFVIHKFLYCFIDNKQSIIKPRLNTKESGKIRGGKPHADEF